MDQLDCRSEAPGEMYQTICQRYDKATAGEQIEVLVNDLPAGLRIGLIEGGIRFTAERAADGGWRMIMHRAASPAMAEMPCMHHVVATPSGTIWASERASRVARIDKHTAAVTGIADVAVMASHIAVDPQESWVFVADAMGDAMIIVNAKTLEVAASIRAPGAPQLPMITDEGIACVTGPITGTLTIIWPTATGFRDKTIEIGPAPHDPVVSPDGRTAFVPCLGDGTVARVDLIEGRVETRFTVGDGPSHLVMNAAGERIYSANTFDGTLSCVSPDGDLIAQSWSGEWAHVPRITPNGKSIYVANFGEDTIAVFNAATMERTAILPSEPYPHGLDIAPDGSVVFATGYSSEHVRVYDATRAVEIARIKVGQGSTHTAFDADMTNAYVACSVADHVARVNLSSHECTDFITL